MDKRRKELLKQSLDVMFGGGDIEEILDRKISPFGSSSHIILPRKHKGKKAKVIIYK